MCDPDVAIGSIAPPAVGRGQPGAELSDTTLIGFEPTTF